MGFVRYYSEKIWLKEKEIITNQIDNNEDSCIIY